MYSPCMKEANEACFHVCFPSPFHNLINSQNSKSECTFTAATVSSLDSPNTTFTDHESLPSLQESFSMFIKAYPEYTRTDQADRIRASEYPHLCNNNVCLDYIGHGLFSYSQILHSEKNTRIISVASSSSSSDSSPSPIASEFTWFDVSHKLANFKNEILEHDGQESEFESNMRERIMDYLNISEGDYSMVFTANQSSAFKLLAEAYPFSSNRNLLTAYDYINDAVDAMTETSKKKGARVKSAEFSWPNLRIQSAKLRKMIVSKRKKTKKGLFVFPLQSRVTGASYSYQWMSVAQENGWHVLLDACALGPKDMDTLGLSLFRPDFLICSFYKVFGDNPSGFGCLLVKKSSASILTDSSTTSIGMVQLIPSSISYKIQEKISISDTDTEKKPEPESQKAVSAEVNEIGKVDIKQKQPLALEMDGYSMSKNNVKGSFEIKCKGLDHADALGLILISTRSRFLINWLVNALMSLRHPSSECSFSLIRIYGPKIKFNRGHAVAFNIFDWKGEKIEPTLVQKLADRNNISLSCGFLQQKCFTDSCSEDNETVLVTGHKKAVDLGIPVVTAAFGLLSNFEDAYRFWAFVSKFLDADFVEKERWRYVALNQKTVEV